MPFICVISRTILTLIDRNLIGVQGQSVQKQLLLNTFLPLLITLPLTYFFYPFSLIPSMLTKECIFSAIIMHLISLAFSYSFKFCSVREVVIRAKIVDLLLMPVLVFFLFAIQNGGTPNSPLYNCLDLVDPVIFWKKELSISATSMSLFLIGVLCLQLFLGDLIKGGQNPTFQEGWKMVICILCWRTIFSSLTQLFRKNEAKAEQENGKKSQSLGNYWMVFLRAVLMLISYVS